MPINLRTGTVEPFIFHHYIKPGFNPLLSAFCTELTGITQATVDAGIALEEALKLFDGWLRERGIEDFVFVTCGDWDLKTCLRKEAAAKGIQLPAYFGRWINLKLVFPKELGKARGMTEMLDLLGL